MNNILKGVIIFAAGAVSGFAGCYIYLNGKYDKLEKEAVENFKDKYKVDFTRQWTKEIEDKEKELRQPIIFDKDNKPVNYAAYASKSRANATRIDEKPKDDNSTVESKKRDVGHSRGQNEHPVDSDEDDGNGQPIILSDEEASDLDNTWDEVEAIYYTGDGMLVNAENEEPIDILYSVTQPVLDKGVSWLKENGDGRSFIFIKVPSTHSLYTVTYEDNYISGDYEGEDE